MIENPNLEREEKIQVIDGMIVCLTSKAFTLGLITQAFQR